MVTLTSSCIGNFNYETDSDLEYISLCIDFPTMSALHNYNGDLYFPDRAIPESNGVKIRIRAYCYNSTGKLVSSSEITTLKFENNTMRLERLPADSTYKVLVTADMLNDGNEIWHHFNTGQIENFSVEHSWSPYFEQDVIGMYQAELTPSEKQYDIVLESIGKYAFILSINNDTAKKAQIRYSSCFQRQLFSDDEQEWETVIYYTEYDLNNEFYSTSALTYIIGSSTTFEVDTYDALNNVLVSGEGEFNLSEYRLPCIFFNCDTGECFIKEWEETI